MKNVLTIASTLVIGFALTLTACGKDKKEAAKAEPTAAEPAKTEPAKADPAKPDPAAAAAKPEDKKDDKGGW